MIKWVVKSQVQSKDLEYELNRLVSWEIYQIIQRPDGLFTIIVKQELNTK